MTDPSYGKSALSSLVSRLALLLALLVGIVPPVAFLAYSYTRLTTQLEGNLRIQAITLTDFITTQPDTWDVARDRMLGTLDRHLSYEKGFRILKSSGEIVYESPSKLRGPFITRARAVHAFGQPVGFIEGQESFSRALVTAFLVFCSSLTCAWLLWGPIRRLPLAALAAAERDLRAQDRYQRALLNNFPFMVWLKDVESRYLAVNSKFLELSSRSSEEQLIGMVEAGISPHELEEKLKADDRAVLNSGQARRVEEWLESEGQRRCLEIYKSPVCLDGEILGTVGYAQDITVRKRNEERLTETLRLLEETQALSRFGGWEYYVATRVMTWSNEVYRLHGVDHDFDVNDLEQTLDFYPPSTAKLVAQAFRQAVEQGVPYDMDVQFLPRGGSAMWIRIMGTPQFLDDKIVCVHGNFMDITEKKNMELELQLANEMLELRVFQRTQELAVTNRSVNQILSSISSILFVIDTEGRVNKWNTAARTILMDPSAEAVGQKFPQLKLTLDIYPLAEGMEKCRQEKQPVKIHNLHYKDSEGKEGFLAFTASPILDEKGELGGILCLGDDITDLKFLESKLAQAQRLESIGQLAAGIAHEINTPVQFIGDSMSFLHDAFTELKKVLDLCGQLKDDGHISEQALEELVEAITLSLHEANYAYLEAEIPKSFTRASEGIHRVTTIVQAMKRFSHPGGADKRAVDINKAVESTLTVCHNEWKYVAECVTDLSADLPPVVCLPGDLNQVLLNVIINAAHAIADKAAVTKSRGQITVTTRQEGDMVVIAIADTGTGVPVAVREKIFDPFFTTKEVGKGTGQGLAIAYDIVVNKHGGSLTFDSEEGRGSTFYIRLPVGG